MIVEMKYIYRLIYLWLILNFLIMPKCKKCLGEMENKRAHSGGCVTVPLPSVPIKSDFNPEDKFVKITDLLQKMIEKQTEIEKRIFKLEEPAFIEEKSIPKGSVVKMLETNLEIAKTVENHSTPENPICSYGIHFPSDFGQLRLNGGSSGPLTPAKKRCFAATGELRKLVDTILTPDFGADILPDSYNATFEFTLIVPAKYCVIDDYRFGKSIDRRSKIINNYAAEPDVKAWCLKVKEKIYKDHIMAQLPSPFTMSSIKQEIMLGAEQVDYSIKQVVS